MRVKFTVKVKLASSSEVNEHVVEQSISKFDKSGLIDPNMPEPDKVPDKQFKGDFIQQSIMGNLFQIGDRLYVFGAIDWMEVIFERFDDNGNLLPKVE